MIDLVGSVDTERGVTVAMILAGVAAVAGFLRSYLRHRTRLAMEREVSARTRARAAGLIHLAGGAHTELTIIERDRDGDRRITTRRGADDADRQDLG